MNEQYSPTGFRVLPTVVKHLLIINVLMFVAAFTFERFNIDLANIFGLHFFKASDFRVYQIITYIRLDFDILVSQLKSVLGQTGLHDFKEY